MSAGLLEKESTGGAIAREGFEYQDAFVLQHLPLWLSQSAFSHVVSEAIGDVEVCYFASTGGVRRVMYEAKDHTLTAPKFWDEIDRFRTVFETSPTEYVRFVLVCRDYNTVTSPLLAKVARLRGVGSSYQSDSVFLANGRTEVIDWAMNNGYRADLAAFVLDHVDFLSFAAEHADSAFSGEVEKHLPCIDPSGRQVGRLRDKCKGHIARSSSGPVYRKDIEAAICEMLGEDSTHWASAPSRVHLLDGLGSLQELGLDVGGFNGPGRATKSTSDWHSLSDAATGIGEFIKESTLRRCIVLDGKQRMSTACLLGRVYSATRGFVLEIEHNGLVYRTDVHDRSDDRFFNEVTTTGHPGTCEGVACIGFPTPVGADLNSVSVGELARLSKLNLDSTRSIDGMEVLNVAVAEAKAALVRFRSQNALSKVHLVVKAPSVFAMVLGHRLNGVCEVQLYDWVDGQYVPTALLSS